MKLEGYAPVDVTPWEGGSGGKAVSCRGKQCAATLRHDGAAGWYTLNLQYFDQNNGAARYRVLVGNQLVDEWTATNWVPTRRIDSSSSTRRVIRGVALRPGDEVRIEGLTDQGETAGVDYLEIQRETN
jgi:alpha-glucuronidase